MSQIVFEKNRINRIRRVVAVVVQTVVHRLDLNADGQVEEVVEEVFEGRQMQRTYETKRFNFLSTKLELNHNLPC